MAVSVTRTTPPNAPSGVIAVADHGFEKIYNMESGSLVDRTTEMTNGTSLPTVFANDDDYIYFGVPVLYSSSVASSTASNRDCRFVDIHVDLETVASATIIPTFQYSNGDNSWATLTVVDGTNGFTQSGTITFTRASIPSHTTWLVATKNGLGATIGDGIARGYVRIRRTADTLATPPVIRTIGTGVLSASTTYYYKVCHLKPSTTQGSSYNALRSLPSAELSATTTTTARCVKISWDSYAGSDYQMVWRTPTSGDYRTGFNSIDYEKLNTSSNKNCDESVQQVKGTYFNHVSGLTRYQDFVIDNGVAICAIYSPTYQLYKAYMNQLFKTYEKGEITVSGGTELIPATFTDIYNADVLNGWGAFVQVSDLYSSYRQFINHDNIILKDYIKDESCSIDTDSMLYSSSSYSSNLTLGRYEYTDSEFYSRGVTFIQSGMATSNFWIYIYNATLYNCLFLDNFLESKNPRTYNRVVILDNSKVYNCSAQANSNFEGFQFNGENIIIDGFYISNARYGLDITLASLSTIITSNITINGTSGVYVDNYTDGGTFYFYKYNFKGAGRPFYNTYATAKNDQYLHAVDCEFIGCDPEDSVIGADTEIYRDWTVGLTILDGNGDPIEDADVTIKDSTETISYTLQTDSNGKISQPTTVAKYIGGTIFNVTYGSKYADDITYYDDFVIEISKTGYETYSLPPMTIDKTIDMIIKLRPQKQLAITNDGVYVNTDPKNKTDTLSLIKI